MKKLLTAGLIFNFLVEAPVGVSLILFPQTVLPAGQLESTFWVRNYGVAVLAISTLVFWVWRNRDSYNTMGAVLGFLMTFHCTLTIALLTSGTQLVGSILHFTLATVFTLLFFQRAKWCITEPAHNSTS